jgi:ABC-2 type transport system ATP-binding protein
VIALGTPSELKGKLTGQTLLRLETPTLLDAMRAVEHEPGVLGVAVFGSGLHVAVDDGEKVMARIRAQMSAQGVALSRLEPIAPSLEDVFVALIEAEERKAA